MILPCPSGSDNHGFGVLIFSLAGRAVSKPASLGSGRRVFPIGDRPPSPSPCVSRNLGGEGRQREFRLGCTRRVGDDAHVDVLPAAGVVAADGQGGEAVRVEAVGGGGAARHGEQRTASAAIMVKQRCFMIGSFLVF